MAGQHRRLRPVLGLVAALLISVGWVASPTPADAALPAWNGGLNLYRTGVFSTQKSWLWCTAAGVQIMRNIKYHREDHSRANQSKYFDYMRARNRYRLPLSAGVDPQGWAAGLRHYVDDRYRLIAHDSFTTSLRLAVIRMRKTNLPVALTVSHGGHGWVLHGFTATADPLKTSSFTITSVRVSGPLWGLQNSSFGYDMRPNTKLTVTQLKRFYTKWWYAPKRMIWDGKFVSIQPVPRTTASTSGAGSTTAIAPAPSASPVRASPSAEPTAPIPSIAVARVATERPVAPSVAPSATTSSGGSAETIPRSPAADIVVAALVGGLGLVLVLLTGTVWSRPAGPRLRDPRAGSSSRRGRDAPRRGTGLAG